MDSKIVKSLIKELKKNTVIQKVFYFFIFLVVIILFNNLCKYVTSLTDQYEGFEDTQEDKYITLRDNDMYDKFY